MLSAIVRRLAPPLVLLMASFAAGYAARDTVQAARDTETLEMLDRTHAARVAQALETQRVEYDRLLAAAEARAAVAEQAAARTRTIIREVQSVPTTTTCAASPAMRAALGGLRDLASDTGAHTADLP